MSLRAIRKKEQHITASGVGVQRLAVPATQIIQRPASNWMTTATASDNSSPQCRRSNSYPNLACAVDVRTVPSPTKLSKIAKSETDVTKLAASGESTLINTKSEVCLKTIAVRNTDLSHNRMIGAQPTCRLYTNRRSMSSTRSELTGGSAMSSSSLSSPLANHSPHTNQGFADTDTIRIPIVGYEVMEERARFTVFKLRVENPFTNNCWLVLRRYTDFVRFNNKLRSVFPTLTLTLPRKKLFGNNFSSVFLDNRVQGLQYFVNAIMANEALRNSQVVRDFFCLDEPPAYSESMEECRAIFEAQEETIAHLKLQLQSKEDDIGALQQKLLAEIRQVELLKHTIEKTSDNCPKCSTIILNNLPDANSITGGGHPN